jgi:hypothetical protein
MTFAAPLFLAAALAAAIPLALHMINRQQAKNLPFATLRFLRISAQKTRRRRQIHDVFLMLMRMAVLLLIALGLAKPTMTNLRSLFGGAASAVAIVLDNSASMGVIDNDKLRFETALHAADQIMEDLRDGDQVALFVTGGTPFPEQGKLDRKQDQVRQMLTQCKVSYEKADVAGRVMEARKLLANADSPNKDIFVISDFQANTWESLKKQTMDNTAAGATGSASATPQPARSPEEQKELEIPIIAVDCFRNPKPNQAVQNVEIEAAVPVAGLPIKATAEVYNAAKVSAQRLLELYVDGNKEASSPVLNIPAEEKVRQDFTFSFRTGGLHRGEVRLVGEDGSKLDDKFYFSMEVDQGIPVAVVKPERHEIDYLEDSFYVERGLGRGKQGSWAIRVTPLTAAQLPNEPLNNFKVIYLVNVPAPDDATAARLRAYVERGGNLFWMCGENVKPEAYNQMNDKAQGSLLPLPLLDVRAPAEGEHRESWHIGFLDKKNAALAHLIDPPSIYTSVLVYKHIRMDPGKTGGGASILARLEDGEPLLAAKKVGAGTVTLLGTSGHVNWTNMPVRPIFVPFLARYTFDLSGAEQARHQGLAGVPIVLEFKDEIRPLGIEVVPPSGETIRLSTQDEKGNKGQAFRFTNTHDVGIYTFHLLQAVSAKQMAFAVNVNPEESESAKIAPQELKDLVAPMPVIYAENVDDLTKTFDILRHGKSLWGTALIIVLVILVFETLVSNRLSPKPESEDEALKNLAPGMRRLGKKGKSAA